MVMNVIPPMIKEMLTVIISSSSEKPRCFVDAIRSLSGEVGLVKLLCKP